MSMNYRQMLLLSAVVLLPASVHAQTAAAGAQAKPDQVVEVLVTAQKRHENPMKTALAVSTFSSASLAAHDVVSVETLAAVTPSFQINGQGPTDNANIRGIGLSVSSPAVASGVPIYRDGLFTSPLMSNEPMFDVAGVEVLRGPQGTLVGANSTGGAVFINSVDPKIGENGGYIQVQGGSYRDVGVQGAVNLPINDVLAARVAFNYESRDSFWTNDSKAGGIGNGTATLATPGDLDQKDVRLGLLYRPSAQFSVLFKSNYQTYDNGGLALTPIPGTPAAKLYLPGKNWTLNDPDGATAEHDFQSRNSLEINYKFDNGINLRSVTGDTYTHELYNEQEYSAAANDPFANHIEDHILTQEFNLTSPSTDRLHWVVGSFSQYWPASVKLSPNTLGPIMVTEHDDKITNALFGEVGYNITPMFEVHGGFRYAFDHAIQTGGVYGNFGGPTPKFLGTEAANQRDGISSGRIGTNITISPTQFAYITLAKGSKTGGVNGGGANFAPESVYDIEAGLKSSWFENHIHTTLGVYDMDYQNMQVQVVTPRPDTTPGGGIANAGSAHIAGVEASLRGHFGNWTIDGNAGYDHSAVAGSHLLNSYLYISQGLSPSGLQCATGQTVGCFNFAPDYQSISGKSLPFSPTWTGSVSVSYLIDLGDKGTLTPQLSYNFSSEQYATVFQNPIDKMQARHLLGAHLTWDYEGYTVTAYGTNLTNQYYITSELNGNEYMWGAPREFGVKVSRSF